MSETKKKKTKKKTTKKKVTKKSTTEELDLSAIMKEMAGFEAEVMSIDSDDTYTYLLPFRNVALNKITGGIPSGVMVEISGESQAGKSYLLYEIMAEAEKQGGTSFLIDPEVAYRSSYGRRVGLKKPFGKSREADIDIVFKDSRKFIKAIRKVNTTCPIVVGIDSYQNLSTKVDLANEEAGKDPRGYQAKIKNGKMGEQLKGFLSFIHKHNVVFVVLNPAKIDSSAEAPMFGPKPLKTLAEQIIGFESTIRIQGRLTKKLTVKVPSLNSAGETKKQIGAASLWTVIKNRLVEPFKKATVDIVYTRGCLKYSGLAEILCNEEKIVASTQAKKKADGTKSKKMNKGFRVTKEHEREEFKNKFYMKIKDMLKDYPEFATPEFSDDFFVAGTTEEDEIDIRKLSFDQGEDNGDDLVYEAESESGEEEETAEEKPKKKTKKKVTKKKGTKK